MNAGELLTDISSQLVGEWPRLDSEVLLAHILGRTRTWLLSHPETPITDPQIEAARKAVEQLQAGVPLPYVIGHWEFYGLDFTITNDVLIPRPETELLVEKAVAWLQASPERRTIVDVGTGSGVIAITIAIHIPNGSLLATDISLAALKIARRNAAKYNLLHQIDFLQCDLLPPHADPLPTDSHFDLICANLPYIPTDTLHTLKIFEQEPGIALDGGKDGLDFYRRLFNLAPEWLAPGGMMLLEIEASLGSQTLSLAYDSFSDVTIHLHQDLAGHDRLLEIMLP